MVIGRLALSSLFHNKARDASPSPPPAPAPAPATAPPWVWPSCKNPRTESFGAAPPGARTIASLFLDSAESSFTASSARHDCSDSLSTASDEAASAVVDVTAAEDDAIVRAGLIRSSDRLLFDPGASATSSILEEKSSAGTVVSGVAVAFESEDPYVDFRASMEEMVAAHGVGDWGWLEEMLGWYIRANGKDTHAAILTAFIDVIVAIADPALASHRSSSCTIAEESSSFEVAEKAKLAV
uniref:Transcription repressor n=1 Tax=Leersia perrieri TaxID=77586 RepID=A0A0D9V845_9ORYZ